MYLITYPDFKITKTMIILHNLSVPQMANIMTILFNDLPEDTHYIISNNRFQWAIKFLGANWIVDTPLSSIEKNNQFVIQDTTIAEICNQLIKKVNQNDH